ncbi:MAG: hypothetical protein R3F59_20200 [Myxococcota bacterium]
MAAPTLLALLLLAPALAEEPRTEREPGPFRIRTVDGPLTTETAGDRGVTAVHGRSVTQTLSWEPLVGPLTTAAYAQLAMIRDSASATAASLATDGFVHPATVAGRPAVQWTATVGPTAFVGAAVDCPRARVLLVTAGQNESAVARIHGHSLDSLDCSVR